MKDKKVSVIIPVYNAESYLEECLESVLKQTFEDYEVILMNDGSTDGSQTVIDRYTAGYPDLFRSYYQVNQGQSAARNHALEYARGGYIAFVDADDYILPDYLEKLYDAAMKKNSELVICSYKKFRNDGTIALIRDNTKWDIPFGGRYSHVFSYSPCAKLMKRSMLTEHGIYFSEGEKMEDGPYSIMTNCMAKNVEVIDYFGYMYRMYDNSTMGTVRQKAIQASDDTLRLPVKGLEAAVNKVLAVCREEDYFWMIEYIVLKTIAGYVYVFSRKGTKQNLKMICGFAERMIEMYFPKMYKNPYIRLGRPKGLPFTHRAAVVMLKMTYRMHILYPFAMLYTRVL